LARSKNRRAFNNFKSSQKPKADISEEAFPYECGKVNVDPEGRRYTPSMAMLRWFYADQDKVGQAEGSLIRTTHPDAPQFSNT
jgi:hypothetical protein